MVVNVIMIVILIVIVQDGAQVYIANTWNFEGGGEHKDYQRFDLQSGGNLDPWKHVKSNSVNNFAEVACSEMI